jgi:hypothetical protein
MSDSVWQPATPIEERLSTARAAGDVPAYLLTLAQADLLLLVPEAGGWAVSRIEDRPCLVAFTSAEALTAITGDVPHRPVRIRQLAADWPDPAVHLAVDPGLPIEAYLDAATVRDVADLAAWPSTPTETALARALDTDDVEAYVAQLMAGAVLMPLPDTDPALLNAASLNPASLNPASLNPVSLKPASPNPGSLDPADPGFVWFRMADEEAVGAEDADAREGRRGAGAWDIGDGERAVGDGESATGDPAPIVAFTSWSRLCDLLGARACVQIPFVAMVDAWPDASALLIDPGLQHGGRIAGAAMQHLRDDVRKRLDALARP